MAVALLDHSSAPPASTDEPAGLRERQRAARDKAILDAAFELMVEAGYDALTMEAVAARVNISRQTLYNYFKSRDEIALRALLTLSAESMAAIESLDSSLTPVERLKRIVRWMIDSKAEPARAALAKARASLAAVLAHPDYQDAFERRAAALAGIVRAAQEHGEVRADLPDRMVVQMLLSLVSAVCHEAPYAFRDAAPLPQVADATIDVFFAGLERP